MTTNVTVQTFDREAEVDRIDPKTGKNIVGPEKVASNSKVTFYVHDGQCILIRERPKDG